MLFFGEGVETSRHCGIILLNGPYTVSYTHLMAKAKELYDSKALVPCTRCAYCMPCPAGLNIPSLINKYNNTALYDFEEVKKDYMSSEVKADACIGCHACEAECPQHLKPSELMPKIHALFTK